MPNWIGDFSSAAGKQYEKLRRSGSRPPITSVIGLLMLDLKKMALTYLVGLIMAP